MTYSTRGTVDDAKLNVTTDDAGFTVDGDSPNVPEASGSTGITRGQSHTSDYSHYVDWDAGSASVQQNAGYTDNGFTYTKSETRGWYFFNQTGSSPDDGVMTYTSSEMPESLRTGYVGQTYATSDSTVSTYTYSEITTTLGTNSTNYSATVITNVNIGHAVPTFTVGTGYDSNGSVTSSTSYFLSEVYSMASVKTTSMKSAIYTKATTTTTQKTWTRGVAYVADTVFWDDGVNDTWCVTGSYDGGSTGGYMEQVFSKVSENTTFHWSDFIVENAISVLHMSVAESDSTSLVGYSTQTVTVTTTNGSWVTFPATWDTAHIASIQTRDVMPYTDYPEGASFSTYSGTDTYTTKIQTLFISGSTYTTNLLTVIWTTYTYATVTTDRGLVWQDDQRPLAPTSTTSTGLTTVWTDVVSTVTGEYPWIYWAAGNTYYDGGKTNYIQEFIGVQTYQNNYGGHLYEVVPIAPQGYAGFGQAGEQPQIYRNIDATIAQDTNNTFSSASGSGTNAFYTTVSDSLTWFDYLVLVPPFSIIQSQANFGNGNTFRNQVFGLITQDNTFTIQAIGNNTDDTYYYQVEATMQYANTSAICDTSALVNVWIPTTSSGADGTTTHTSTHNIKLVMTLGFGSQIAASDLTGHEVLDATMFINQIFGISICGGRQAVAGESANFMRGIGVYWQTTVDAYGNSTTTVETQTDPVSTQGVDSDKVVACVGGKYYKAIGTQGDMAIVNFPRYVADEAFNYMDGGIFLLPGIDTSL